MNNEVIVRLELYLSPEQAIGLIAQLEEGLCAQERNPVCGFQNMDEVFEAAYDAWLLSEYGGRYV